MRPPNLWIVFFFLTLMRQYIHILLVFWHNQILQFNKCPFICLNHLRNKTHSCLCKLFAYFLEHSWASHSLPQGTGFAWLFGEISHMSSCDLSIYLLFLNGAIHWLLVHDPWPFPSWYCELFWLSWFQFPLFIQPRAQDPRCLTPCSIPWIWCMWCHDDVIHQSSSQLEVV